LKFNVYYVTGCETYMCKKCEGKTQYKVGCEINTKIY